MKKTRKVLCIIGVGLISVLLAVSTVYACCGMDPVITDDEVIPGCPGDEVTISGNVTAYDEWLVPGSYSTDLAMTIEVTDPGGGITALDVELTLTLDDPPNAAYDFSATYTPSEPGQYTYVKTASWTTDAGGTMTRSASGTFTVEECLAGLDIKGGSCPNPLNRKAKGGTPVAILGNPEVLAQIDLTKVILTDEAGNTYSPMQNKDGSIMMTMEDSTQPGDYDPEDCDDCFDADDPANFNCDLIDTTPGDGVPDGILDSYCGDGTDELVLKFDLRGVAGERGDCVKLTLSILDTSIELSDSMIIVK